MPVHILIFNTVSVVGALMLITHFVTLSRRQHRIHPGVWAMVGSFSIFWHEGPYAFAGFCNYCPARFGTAGCTRATMPRVPTEPVAQ
ncbi:hypothetical protein M1247_06345 [Mycobacterium sp. 21AC1]|uniref:hypothetical protein n=1 Tax=[Mycobacterium] appelbergii TaxID=2939269 RepID=UPI00293907A1|nr:hypothetical protein [Mycobacterium sp. 21AC1]MDV3124526.1 hypothetical protein [Mycobacterium sp. 21AC1]